MFSKYIKTLLIIILAAAGVGAMQSCMDEPLMDSNLNFEEGHPTNISFKIKVPEMTVATRGDMEPGADSELNSLWIGIFSASSGKCTYAGFHNPSADRIHVNGNGFYELENIETESGNAYIVAVGNPDHNSCIVNGDLEDLGDYLPESKDEAIGRGFNWNAYQQIAVKQLNAGDIGTPTGYLIMSGIFTNFRESESGHKADAWETANFTPVGIPVMEQGSYTMNGAIHLRRLISQVKFNIKVADNPDKNNRRMISVSPRNYRVFNVPYSSWLHEQKSPSPKANSGDNITVSGFSSSNQALPYKANYITSPTFSDQYIEGDEVNGFTFDFWMLENKQRTEAAMAQNDYNLREQEVKAPDGSNTGIYTALCGSGGTETMNNAAAYVVINCHLKYTDAGLETLNGQNVEMRTAETTYTIHLGGIGGNWRDFNHRRNHKYTYNITVVDVDKILVEANEDTETAPGVEGVVTDVTNDPIELDAHYGVFNMRLSNLERTGGSGATHYEEGKFPFRMEVYYGNERYVINEENYTQFDPKFYNWVEFRPTSGEKVLQPYNPASGNGSDGKTFTIKDLTDLDKYPGNNGSKNRDETTEQWYTVFINEYAYEDSSDENDNNWAYYVDKPNRLCWLQTTSGMSSDGESIHVTSKYCISQSSIQTFYAIPGDPKSVTMDAIGLEHVNETWGLNLRWYNVMEGHSWSTDNGRKNQVDYVNRMRWEDILNQTRLQVIDGINTNAFQYSLYQDLTRGPYYVPMVNQIDNYNEGEYSHVDGGFNHYNRDRHNINTRSYITTLNACMNRNRDLNGNGIIDLNEIRWYVPSSSELVDMVLGRNSLDHPLMDYKRNDGLYSPQNTGTAKPHHANTRFHYVASNRRVLWAEEGVTVNEMVNAYWEGNSTWNLPAQNVRCVRALGTNLNSSPDGKITPAFTVDNPNYPTKIYPTYYEDKNMRAYRPTPLAPHQETSELNRLCFEGFEFQTRLIGFPANQYIDGWNYTDRNGFFQTNENRMTDERYHDMILNLGNETCQNTFGQGWRMPNIKEAALIRLAMNNAGLSWTSDPGGDNPVITIGNYDIGHFLSCTYREFGVGNNNLRSSKNGYYTSIHYAWNEDMDNGKCLGRAHCVTEDNQKYRLRCVRDIR